MYASREINLSRRGKLEDGRPITAESREQLLKPYLPQPRGDPSRSHSSSPARSSSPSIPQHDSQGGRRSATRAQKTKSRHGLVIVLRTVLDRIVFLAIQLCFSMYIRTRQTYNAVVDRILAILYYHHRTPELIQKDLKDLSRLPKHLSVIVELQGDRRGGGTSEGLAKLIEDVSELSAWCACAGIPMLSVYEQTGILKSHIPSLHTSLTHTFRSYFPPTSLPTLQIRAPNHQAYSPPTTPPTSTSAATPSATLNILLLSANDGRATLVDLTKTLTEMSQRGKLHPSDVSAELIDAEISESSCGEPDLLVVMAPSSYRARARRKKKQRQQLQRRQRKQARGASSDSEPDEAILAPAAGGEVCLRGYPPWQVRLTEIFHVQDNNAGVGYQVFLRALYSFAKAEMRFGR